MKSPKVIVLDGADGVGKTTQINMLKEYLSKNYNVLDNKALGGDGKDWVQVEIRKLLLSPDFPEDDPELEETLFGLADIRSLKIVEDKLAKVTNGVVLQDRGYVSHIAYGAVKVANIEALHQNVKEAYEKLHEAHGLLNIVLIPEDEKLAMERVASRGQPTTPRLENLQFQKAVINNLQEFPSTFGTVGDSMYITVKRNESREDIHKSIINMLREVYGI